MFGQRLSDLRKDNHQTQEDLAEILHVSKYTISSWEQGRSCPPVHVIKQICEHYDVSADYLIGLLPEWDPGYEYNRRHQKFTAEERKKLKEYEQFLIFQRKSKKTGTDP